LRPGAKVIFSDTFSAESVDEMDNGAKVVSFDVEGDLMQALNTYGKVPLPHYITPESDEKANRERYQTIFAEHPGAVAAPTAGLHFTDEMFHALDQKEVEKMMVTLHVGPGTFRPVTVTDIRDHEMHYENYAVTADVARKLNERKDKQRSISVGTTCCRVLESAIGADGKFKEGSGDTGIFIYPGYNFKYVDCLLTNFHLPQSSLLMLVSALAGSDLIKEAYHKAVKEKFRFYSYGDAMLIL
jgi:S-adenosylmethionine:tRNA ribosyltransferase-isomerase